MNKWVLLGCVLFGNWISTYAQDFLNQDPKEYTIDTILVRGNRLYTSSDIINTSGLEKGQSIKLPSDRTKSIIDKLWNKQLFSDINLKIQILDTVALDIAMIIEVKEMDQILEFVFTGLDDGDVEDIEEQLNLKSGQKNSQILKEKIRRHIQDFLFEEGYYAATIHIKEIPTEYNGIKAIKLKIEVDLKEEVGISEINFHGNQYFSDFGLRWAMDEIRETSIWNWFVTSRYIPNLLKADLKIIEQKYQEEGFRNMKITKDSLSVDEDGELVLDIYIDEGKQYYFNDISFVGNSVYEERTLRDILGIQKGDVYNAVLLQQQIGPGAEDNDLTTKYQDNGYLFVNIQAKEKGFNEDSINLEINITEGAQARFNRVMVKGNTRTNDEVVYRMLRTKPGNLFSRTAIKESIREIAALRFFNPETIRPDVVPDQNTGTVDLTYNVEFSSSSQITLQGGYGAGTFVGSVGFNFNNFAAADFFDGKEWTPVPMGDAQQVGLRYEKSLYSDIFSISFSEPWLGGDKPRNFSVGFNLSSFNSFAGFNQGTIYNRRIPTTSDVTGTMNVYGVNVGLAERLSWPDYYFSLGHTVGLKMYALNNYRTGLFSFTDGKAYDLSYTITLSRNSAGPNPFFPIQGSEFVLQGSFSPPYSLFNPKVDDEKWLEFYKFKYSSKVYSQIYGQLVLRSSYEIGLLDSYTEHSRVSTFKNFTLGGSGMRTQNFVSDIIALRGYPDGYLTPVGGGQVYNKYVFELRYPVLLEASASVSLLAFLEGAKAWNNISDFTPFEAYQSAGFGTRILVPMVGLIGLDLGYGYDRPNINNDSKWEFHFTLGQNL